MCEDTLFNVQTRRTGRETTPKEGESDVLESNDCSISLLKTSHFGTYSAKHFRSDYITNLNPATEELAMSYRTFVDSAGRRWEVWLVTPAAAERRRADRRAASSGTFEGTMERRKTPERRRSPYRRSVTVASEYNNGWLCFESEGEKRRLVPVPEGWTEAGPDRLSTLLQAAKRVVKCGP